MSDLQKSNNGLANPLEVAKQHLAKVNAEGSYSQQITRESPSAVVIMVDQSSSMNGQMPDGRSKAQAVADQVNALLDMLCARCQKSEPLPRDYFDVALIGYSGASDCYSLWEGALAGRDWAKISDIKQLAQSKTEEVEVSMRGKMIKQTRSKHYWLEAKAVGQTPMATAFKKTNALLAEWTKKHPHNYPPVVFNITDGAQTDATDAEMQVLAKQLRDLRTSDGRTLLINVHFSSQANNPVLFPQSKAELPTDKYAHLLFDMSSHLPSGFGRTICLEIKKEDLSDNMPAFVGMGYAVGVEELFKMMEIGTRQSQQLLQ